MSSLKNITLCFRCQIRKLISGLDTVLPLDDCVMGLVDVVGFLVVIAVLPGTQELTMQY